MKNLIKIISVIFLALFYAVNFASASTTGGNLNTGIDTGIGGTVIVNPTANVPSGIYTSVQYVSLAAIGSLSVYYTTNGDAPICLASSIYSAPIVISATSTLEAIACYANSITSSISSFPYVINLPTTPTPSPTPTPVQQSSGGGGGSYTPPPTSKTGDIDGNGKVDKYDFAMLMASWDQTGSNSSDLNHDNKVDKYDFALLMLNWGK
ncbi:MAG: FN3 associated domain-containing protein [bacterium]|nr:FN3 associated domain-containing protein [bacterium]